MLRDFMTLYAAIYSALYIYSIMKYNMYFQINYHYSDIYGDNCKGKDIG